MDDMASEIQMDPGMEWLENSLERSVQTNVIDLSYS